jgi:hypothetical protein
VGIREWLGSRRAAPTTWQVHVDNGDVVIDGRRYPLAAAQSVRVVPLTGGTHHSGASGWQVTLERDDGDVLIGSAMPDWQPARALADQVCQASGLPLDELTARLFSRAGLPSR